MDSNFFSFTIFSHHASTDTVIIRPVAPISTTRSRTRTGRPLPPFDAVGMPVSVDPESNPGDAGGVLHRELDRPGKMLTLVRNRLDGWVRRGYGGGGDIQHELLLRKGYGKKKTNDRPRGPDRSRKLHKITPTGPARLFILTATGPLPSSTYPAHPKTSKSFFAASSFFSCRDFTPSTSNSTSRSSKPFGGFWSAEKPP